jgi:SAM-dependent methyltransferase
MASERRAGELPTARNGKPASSPRFEEQWRTRFEEFAEARDDDAGIAGWTLTGLDARIRRFLGLWKPGEAGRRWLDAGCGAGTYTRILLEHGLQVVGTDYSLPTLRKAASRNGSAVFALADVRRLPFRPGLFDGVLCLGVTQALADSRSAMQELALQVRPGGELWVDALNGWCVVHAYDLLRRRLKGRPDHLRYESPRRMKRVLSECGFVNVHLHWLPIVPPRSQRLQGLIESGFAGWALRIVPLLGMLISHAFIVRAEKPPLRSASAGSAS